MTRRSVATIAVVSVLAGVFVLAIVATVLRWSLPAWWPILALALPALGLIIAFVGRRRWRGRDADTPSASDPYSDAQLGRLPPTFPEHTDSSIAAAGPAPDHILDPEPDRARPPDDRRAR